MKISNYEPQQAQAVAALWNKRAPLQGFSYLTEREFTELVLENSYFNKEYAYTAEEEGRVCGFVCGASDVSLPGGAERGYFACLLLDERADDEETADLLLTALEGAFAGTGRKTCDVLFFNPIRLPWVIPGTPGHLHNNAPGLWTESRQYGWFLRRGYAERSREVAYYLNITDFSMPEKIRSRERELAGLGYEAALYDPGRHTGLERMLDGLGNQEWRKEIPEAAERGLPFLAAGYRPGKARQGSIVGFAGPIYPEKSGRGYFTGIGVAKEQEGRGLGSLLFYRLCQEEKRAGAAYMSLFTGADNKAGKIYEGAGFRRVREFAVMRKELGKE